MELKYISFSVNNIPFTHGSSILRVELSEVIFTYQRSKYASKCSHLELYSKHMRNLDGRELHLLGKECRVCK